MGDIKALQAMQEACRELIAKASAIDWTSEGVHVAAVATSVIAGLEAERVRCGHLLALLERTAPGWRP
ncbi:MAG: hypothetical protein QM601_04680 [Pseudoxanthomonas sp.]